MRFLLLLFVLFFSFSPTAVSARSLSLGMSGSDVIELQKSLITKGYLSPGNSTGYFGPLTDAALKKFQCNEGVICSGDMLAGYGIYGPKTASAMRARLSLANNPSQINPSIVVPKATGAFEYSGWMPDWRKASSTADVLPNLDKLTSVMPFGYTVSSSGKLIDHAKIDEAPWPEFIATAKAKGVRVIPTVFWGDASSMHRILSNTTKRIALEDEIANLVKAKGFDGIDIDFEAKNQETIDFFSTFLKGLYMRMGNKWVYCAIESRMPLEHRYPNGADRPADATDYANDYTEINKYCDRVELMTYDQGIVDKKLNALRGDPYAPVADPDWVEAVVNLASQTISKNKLVIGIPTYGYEYSLTPNATTSGYTYKRLWAFNPSYAEGIMKKLNIEATRTGGNELGFTYDPKKLDVSAPAGDDATKTEDDILHELGGNVASAGNTLLSSINPNQTFNFVTWSDSYAMEDKINLAKKLGVRGVAFFSLGGAEDQRIWQILK